MPGFATALCHVALRRSDRMDRLFLGDVSERPKEHAWKACVVQATAGSNPAVTAKMKAPILPEKLESRGLPRSPTYPRGNTSATTTARRA